MTAIPSAVCQMSESGVVPAAVASLPSSFCAILTHSAGMALDVAVAVAEEEDEARTAKRAWSASVGVADHAVQHYRAEMSARIINHGEPR